MRIWPGHHAPLGSTFDGIGTNFSVFSEVADRVELCLFDDQGVETRVDLTERDGALLARLPAGREARPALRLQGPRPVGAGAGVVVQPREAAARSVRQGHRRAVELERSRLSAITSPRRNPRATISTAPRSCPRAWSSTRSSTGGRIAGRGRRGIDTVVYETHVKGFTSTHPLIPDELRGTYAGMAHPAAIEYLQRLGVTAVELLPVHQFVQDSTPASSAAWRNYWGYNSIGYFAPHNEYAPAASAASRCRSSSTWCKTMHEAGIEVILDVVYNHTAEGNHLGPMLSLKGIDNAAYYRLVPDNRRYYVDYTGTGNTLNMRHPHVLQLIMDSLRYWVSEMHVDGFRFDLAATLARELHEVDRLLVLLRPHPAGSRSSAR